MYCCNIGTVMNAVCILQRNHIDKLFLCSFLLWCGVRCFHWLCVLPVNTASRNLVFTWYQQCMITGQQLIIILSFFSMQECELTSHPLDFPGQNVPSALHRNRSSCYRQPRKLRAALFSAINTFKLLHILTYCTFKSDANWNTTDSGVKRLNWQWPSDHYSF